MDILTHCLVKCPVITKKNNNYLKYALFSKYDLIHHKCTLCAKKYVVISNISFCLFNINKNSNFYEILKMCPYNSKYDLIRQKYTLFDQKFNWYH